MAARVTIIKQIVVSTTIPGDLIAKSNTELLLYSVNNITSGTDSKGQVTVRLAKGGRVVNGLGSDTDIVIASSMAYLNALNKLVSKAERAHPQV